MTKGYRFRRMVLMWLVTAALLFTPVPLLAQGTNIDAPDNKYSISDDVRLGREAAAQVEQRMPILAEGGDVDDYVEQVGQRLKTQEGCHEMSQEERAQAKQNILKAQPARTR